MYNILVEQLRTNQQHSNGNEGNEGNDAADGKTTIAMSTKQDEPPPPPVVDKFVCCHEGCSNQARSGGKCTKHGGKKLCNHEGCTRSVINSGVCRLHGAKDNQKRCSMEGCTKNAVRAGRCWKHGERCNLRRCSNAAVKGKGGWCTKHWEKFKKRENMCSFRGCSNPVVNKGGACTKHEKRVEAVYCIHENCPNLAKPDGVCVRHGSKWDRQKRQCSVQGCTKKARARYDVCFGHGAKERKRECSYEGCTKHVQIGKMCKLHLKEKVAATLPKSEDDHDFLTVCTCFSKTGVFCGMHGKYPPGSKGKDSKYPPGSKGKDNGNKTPSSRPAKGRNNKQSVGISHNSNLTQLASLPTSILQCLLTNKHRTYGRFNPNGRISNLTAFKRPNAKVGIAFTCPSVHQPEIAVISKILPDSIFRTHRLYLSDGTGGIRLEGVEVIAVNGQPVLGPRHAAELAARAVEEVRLTVKAPPELKTRDSSKEQVIQREHSRKRDRELHSSLKDDFEERQKKCRDTERMNLTSGLGQGQNINSIGNHGIADPPLSVKHAKLSAIHSAMILLNKKRLEQATNVAQGQNITKDVAHSGPKKSDSYKEQVIQMEKDNSEDPVMQREQSRISEYFQERKTTLHNSLKDNSGDWQAEGQNITNMGKNEQVQLYRAWPHGAKQDQYNKWANMICCPCSEKGWVQHSAMTMHWKKYHPLKTAAAARGTYYNMMMAFQAYSAGMGMAPPAPNYPHPLPFHAQPHWPPPMMIYQPVVAPKQYYQNHDTNERKITDKGQPQKKS